VEGVYHVTIELLRRRPVLLLTSSGGDDVGGSGNGVVVDRRTRVEPTARAPVIVFNIILSRARTPSAPSLRFLAVDVTTLSFSVFYQTYFGGYGGMLYAGGTHYRRAG